MERCGNGGRIVILLIQFVMRNVGEVVGNIVKGDQLVSSNNPGVATSMVESEYRPGIVIGKALENYSSDQPGVITIVVGRI